MPSLRRQALVSPLRSLVTPEGVDLGIRIASAGARASAFLLDFVILCVCAIMITIVALFGLTDLRQHGLEVLFICWLILIFVLRNGYFLIFEAGRYGATPGKRILGVRVASRSGEGLAIDQVIARNLMREIEIFLPLSILAARASTDMADSLTTVLGLVWSLLFLFFPLFNRDRMRIGDLLAGTWVVEAPRVALVSDLSAAAKDQGVGPRFSHAQLDVYGITELQRLEEVLRGDNHEALRTVAETIGKKIRASTKARDARPFLTAYYAQLRAHLERKLLLGSRRTDKHSK